jgi:O-antigen ligase
MDVFPMIGLSFSTPYYLLSAFVALLIFLSNASVAYYYYVAVLLVFASPILACLKSQVFVKLRSVEVSLIVALSLYAAAAVLNMWAHGSWSWDDFNEPSKFLLVVVVFLAVRRHGFKEGVIVIFSILGVFSAAALAWYQSEYLAIGRVFGSTHKIISSFGLLCLLAGYFALIYIVHYKVIGKWRYPLALVVIIATVYPVAETGTKGVWIAIPGVLSLILMSKWDANKRVLILLTATSFIGAVLIFLFNDMVNSRLSGLSQPLITYIKNGAVTDGSVSVRLETWKASLMMFIDNPSFGVGLGNFVSAKAKLIAVSAIQSRAGFVAGPHNDLIGTLAIQGLVGLSALLFMYYAFLRLSWKFKAYSVELYWCSTGLILIYVLSGLAGDRLSSNLTATYLALMMAIFAGQMSYKYTLAMHDNKNL